jgi:hypothetical protein
MNISSFTTYLKSHAENLKNDLQKDNTRLFIISIFILSLYSIGIFIKYINWDFDDSYIVYRIVKNILNGLGWTYNPGESYNPSTSVLNTLIITTTSLLTDDIQLSAHILGSIWILLSGIFLHNILWKRFNFFFSLCSAVIYIHILARNLTWGLEIHLFSFLALLFIYIETKPKPQKFSWPILGFLILARPDGVIFLGLKWINLFFKKRSLSLKGLLSVSLILLPWILFSSYHFGQIFPNTLAQKVWQGNSGYWGTGRIYLNGIIDRLSFPAVQSILIVIAIPIGLLYMIKEKSKFIYIVIFSLLQQLVYIALNVPPYHWYFSFFDISLFIIIVYAVGMVLSTTIKKLINLPLSKVYLKRKKQIYTIVLILFLVLSLISITRSIKNTETDARDAAYRKIALKTKQQYPEGSLAVVEAGTIGYFTDYEIIDITGLTSGGAEFISGENNDLFFENPPDMILFHSPLWHFEKEIFQDIRLEILYNKDVEYKDPNFPMTLYVLQKENFPLTEEIIKSYIRDNYTPFVINPEVSLSDMNELTGDNCYLDTVNEQSRNIDITIKHFLHLKGWAIDMDNEKTPENITLILISDSDLVYSIKGKRLERIDVADVFNNQSYLLSGFGAEGSVLDIPNGGYSIKIIQWSDKEKSYCDLKRYIEVNNN